MYIMSYPRLHSSGTSFSRYGEKISREICFIGVTLLLVMLGSQNWNHLNTNKHLICVWI